MNKWENVFEENNYTVDFKVDESELITVRTISGNGNGEVNEISLYPEEWQVIVNLAQAKFI